MVTKTEQIVVRELKLNRLSLTLESASPLIMHQFSQKAIDEIAFKKAGQGKQKSKIIDPIEQYEESLYKLDPPVNGFKYYIPAIWLKKAMVWVCGSDDVDFLTATRAKGEFFTWSEGGGDKCGLTHGPEDPHSRQDWVRTNAKGGTGGSTVVHRGEFCKWSARFEITYNTSILSTEQVLFLVQLAGFKNGFGERRAQKSGEGYGSFTYDLSSVTVKEQKGAIK